MASSHPDYSKLAARIAIDNLHKNTSSMFSDAITMLHGCTDKDGGPAPLIHDEVYQFVMANREILDASINYDRDFDYDYFAFKTLERCVSITFSTGYRLLCISDIIQCAFWIVFFLATIFCYFSSYLLRVSGVIIERPQHMIMRVACGIHCGDVQRTIETYELMSLKYFTHATPTLFNAGTPRPQMSSCRKPQYLSGLAPQFPPA